MIDDLMNDGNYLITPIPNLLMLYYSLHLLFPLISILLFLLIYQNIQSDSFTINLLFPFNPLQMFCKFITKSSNSIFILLLIRLTLNLLHLISSLIILLFTYTIANLDQIHIFHLQF